MNIFTTLPMPTLTSRPEHASEGGETVRPFPPNLLLQRQIVDYPGAHRNARGPAKTGRN
jgi:hypothetical protein